MLFISDNDGILIAKKNMHINDFLPNFKKLFPGRPRLISRIQKEQELAKAKQYSFDEFRLIFEALLPSKLFDVKPGSERKRVFTRELTFWSFFYQTLTGVSCSGVLKAVQCWFESKGRSLPSSNNSAYCQARKRLPDDYLEDIFDATVEASSKQNNKIDRHWGRDVKVIDGTSFRMPDTEANQLEYPQHSGTIKGCSFPYTTTVALFSLSTRALHAFKSGNKNDSEKVLWRDTWSAIDNNDIILGDRGFCSYVNIVSLKKYHGADSVFRLGEKVQKIHFDKCQKISNNQWLDTWTKPKAKPKYLSKEEWNDIP
ncbi:MAG: transposase, partial [Lentisphaeraceae bacterium]|nr:transposase [Lentisphaeraceae bacterium]